VRRGATWASSCGPVVVTVVGAEEGALEATFGSVKGGGAC